MEDSTSSNNDDCETESHKYKDDSISSFDNYCDKEYREEAI